jgi:hypothetical protein
MYTPLALQLSIHQGRRIARDCKADPFVAARVHHDEGIDSYDMSFNVDQGTTAIPGINRRIRLYVNQRSSALRCLATELTTPKRTELAGLNGFPSANTTWPCFNSSESANGRYGRFEPFTFMTARSVSESITTTVAGRDRSTPPSPVCSATSLASRNQMDSEAVGRLHDVRVRKDVSIRAHDDPGPARILRRQQYAVSLRAGLRVTVVSNLYHSALAAAGNLYEARAQFS